METGQGGVVMVEVKEIGDFGVMVVVVVVCVADGVKGGAERV